MDEYNQLMKTINDLLLKAKKEVSEIKETPYHHLSYRKEYLRGKIDGLELLIPKTTEVQK